MQQSEKAYDMVPNYLLKCLGCCCCLLLRQSRCVVSTPYTDQAGLCPSARVKGVCPTPNHTFYCCLNSGDRTQGLTCGRQALHT